MKDHSNVKMETTHIQNDTYNDQYLPPEVGEVHKNTCQEIFGLTKTPEEANKALQDAMQKYLAEKK